MNLLEIRTEARRLMAETSLTASYASDTDINKFINEGIKDACIKAEVLERTKTAPISTTVASYLLPWDFLRAVSVINHNKVTLDLIEPINLGRLYIITGKPLYYYITESATSYSTKLNLTTYDVDDLVVPPTANGYIYGCTTTGTSGAAPPTYGTTPGSSTTDGSITWVCRELFTRQYAVNLYDTPTTAGEGTGTYTFIYKAMDEGLYTDTDCPNFPSDKHHLLVLYACHRWAIMGKDLTSAVAFLTDYATGLGLKIAQPTGGENSA